MNHRRKPGMNQGGKAEMNHRGKSEMNHRGKPGNLRKIAAGPDPWGIMVL
ncbi:MAG: hypothetical protein IKD92_01785 [Lachnospiraceae bacterium]|nr:hypothetical protein [Lachnospiraceae bacterium]